MNTYLSRIGLLLIAATLSLTLPGCGGDDGAVGSPGRPGGEPAATIAELHLSFDKVVIEDGSPSVEFSVANELDMPVVGLQKLRFAAAQLLPEGATGAGNGSQWQYFGDETCDLAGTCPGTFVDFKNGRYSYRFAMKLTENTSFNFKNSLAQRVLVRVYNTPLPDGTGIPVSNAFVDYSADSGAAPGYSRKIVATKSCNACHRNIGEVKHGGGYVDVNYCATCHSKGKVGAGKEFPALIHAKHKDIALGALQSCQSCHQPSQSTPDWANWSQVPGAQSCGSCHSNIDFVKGQGHSAQPDNSNCIACHNSDWTAELHSTRLKDTQTLLAQLGMKVELAVQADDAVRMSVTLLDTQGQPLDAAKVLGKIQRLETITNLGPNFPVMGYAPSPVTGYQKISKDLVKAGLLQADVSLESGKLQFTTTPLPFGQGDTDTAFSFIGLQVCNQGPLLVDCGEGVENSAMKAALAFTTKSGKTPTTRHTDSVNFGACRNCHGDTFAIHQTYHTGFVMTEQLGRAENGKLTVGVDACVVCHTPDGTYAMGANRGALEMKLHLRHANEAVIKDCRQCHNDFNLAAFEKKGALATKKGLYTTPITATCTSCHAPESVTHGLEKMGAIVDGDYTQANQAAQSETCFYCHKPSVEDHTKVAL